MTSSTCGAANGSACAGIVGGVAPFVITWDDPFSTIGLCITNQFAGVYSAILSDGNGCSAPLTVAISDISGPTIDALAAVNVTCGGAGDGSASVAASGGVPPLTYIWQDVQSNVIDTITTINNQGGGLYSITVIDSNGCSTSQTIVINEPSSLSSAIVGSSDPTCDGFCNGSATAVVGGGTSPYGFLWSNGQTVATAVGLCAGTHDVTLTDFNGCQSFSTLTLIAPDALVIQDSVIDVLCNGDANGAIYLNVTGGSPFYSYSWSPIPGFANLQTNLPPDVYTAVVTDINGCAANINMTVGQPDAMNSFDFPISSICGDPNGATSIFPMGGTGNYSYLWTLGQTDSIITGLMAGTYSVTITDGNGCTYVDNSTIGNIDGVVVTGIAVTHVICNGDQNGTALVTPNGGVLPYNYQWNDPLFQTTAMAIGLAPGTIAVVVTDNSGCVDSDVDIIDPVSAVVLTAFGSDTICTGEAASIGASAAGGTPGYNYSWVSGAIGGGPFDVFPTDTTVYTVTATDAAGCPSNSASILVVVRPPLTVTADGGIGCIGDPVTITAIGSGGLAPLTYTWDNGYVGTSQTFTNLTVNTSFEVTLTDSNGCSSSVLDVANVTLNPNPVADFIYYGNGCTPVEGIFLDASIIVPAPAAITGWLWDFGDPSSTFNSSSQANASHIYDIPGTYSVTLTVTSDSGCTDVITLSNIITTDTMPSAIFYADPYPETSLLSSTISFFDSSSSNVVTWVWDFGDPDSEELNVDSVPFPVHSYTEIGFYDITLTVFTIDSCWSTYTLTIEITEEYVLFAPNAFTPNGDGDNDYFMPKGVGIDGEDFEMWIYDRWGDLIATVMGVFNDDPGTGWNGIANGGSKIAQIDVYVWIVKTKDPDGEKHEYVGHVTLIN